MPPRRLRALRGVACVQCGCSAFCPEDYYIIFAYCIIDDVQFAQQIIRIGNRFAVQVNGQYPRRRRELIGCRAVEQEWRLVAVVFCNTDSAHSRVDALYHATTLCHWDTGLRSPLMRSSKRDKTPVARLCSGFPVIKPFIRFFRRDELWIVNGRNPTFGRTSRKDFAVRHGMFAEVSGEFALGAAWGRFGWEGG